MIFDETHDQYLWLFLGWEGKKKISLIQVHIRIKNNKIYIEEDWTEEGIANELLKEGEGIDTRAENFQPYFLPRNSLVAPDLECFSLFLV